MSMVMDLFVKGGVQLWVIVCDRVAENWCNVLMKYEQLGKLKAAVMLKTRLSSLKFAERVHEWTQVNTKEINRVRNAWTEPWIFGHHQERAVLGASQKEE